MEMFDILRRIMDEVTTAIIFASLAIVATKFVTDIRASRRAREQVLAAEKAAFKTGPEAFAAKTAELSASQEQLEKRTTQLQEILDRAQASLNVGLLFDLYNKQIEKYQTETQARAGWSFIFAIVAMFAGLSFVMWGGVVVVSGGGWEKVAAGSLISAIGGAVSAYITTTFLDVHRLSLLQLNRYFRQPVINANVLTAQRLADVMEAPEERNQAYIKILERVVDLIREGTDSEIASTFTPHPKTRVPRGSSAGNPTRSGSPRKKTVNLQNEDTR